MSKYLPFIFLFSLSSLSCLAPFMSNHLLFPFLFSFLILAFSLCLHIDHSFTSPLPFPRPYSLFVNIFFFSHDLSLSVYVFIILLPSAFLSLFFPSPSSLLDLVLIVYILIIPLLLLSPYFCTLSLPIYTFLLLLSLLCFYYRIFLSPSTCL